jgi:uncharacterized membrane protein
MKKFNIACIICILAAITAIVFNLVALSHGIYPVYFKTMLIINGILLGMVLGECWMGNMLIKHQCNFEKFDKEDSDNE